MKHLMTALSCALAICAAKELSALDAVWNKANNNGTWVMPKYWLDTEGNAVELPPTNINDTAYITTGSNAVSSIVFGYCDTSATIEWGGSCPLVTFDSVRSDYMPTLNLGTRVNANNYPLQTVSLANPDGFQGFWSSDKEVGRGEIILRATSEHVPVLSHLDTFGYMGVNVPDAGTTARVRSLFRNGALLKRGDGDLVIERGAGWDSRIYCRQGSVILKGRPAGMTGIPSGAWLHLDATRDDTMTTFTDEGGRTCIAEWRDCDGGSVSALTNGFASPGSTYLLPYSRAPYLSPERSPSGLQLVDFGANWRNATDATPSNCWLKLSAKSTEIREVFYAARCTGTTDSLCLLGHDADGIYDFAGGGNDHLFVSWCSPTLKSPATSTLTFNGAAASWRQQKPSRYGSTPADFHVVGAANTKGLTFNALGTDRRYSNYSGGWVLGELLVYTRELSEDERRAVVDYLMGKWQKDYRPDDVGELVLDTELASVTVPEGRIARVKSIAAHLTANTKIVKKGGGTLVVDGISPAGIPIVVEGGSIRVETPTVTTNAPAAEPYLWLDATQTDTLVFKEGEENDENGHVTRWNDRRPGATVYAEVPVGQTQDNGDLTVWDTDPSISNNYPWRVASSSPTALPAIDFGLRNKNEPEKSTASFMWMQPHYQANVYAGFVALRVKQANTGELNYFGGTTTDMLRNSYTSMLQGNWVSLKPTGIAWTFDGRPVDPWYGDITTYNNTRWHVIGFAGSEKAMAVDLIAKYTLRQNGYCGNLQIGEMILFDRPLSADERRNTEAYLMARWLGKPHPESAEGFSGANYRFDDGVEAVYDIDGDATITNATFTAATLVKRGEGDLAYLDRMTVTNITGIAVEEGSLTVDLELKDDAAFRFDSSKLDSFTSTYTSDDGNGGLQTNILEWTDQVSGMVAYSAHKDGFTMKYASLPSGSTCTNPTLQYATMPWGEVKPVVDFGDRLNIATLWQLDGDGNRYLDYTKANNSAGMLFTSYYSTTKFFCEEAHVIAADRPGLVGYFFTASTTDSKGTVYVNRDAARIIANGSNLGVKAGVVCLDGTNVPITAAYPSGFHLVSLQPTNSILINTIALERNCNSGGNRIGYYVGYKKAHAPDVFNYVKAQIMHEWLNGPRPTWIRDLTGIHAAAGSSVTLQTEALVRVNQLSGGGTITAPALTNVTSLVFGGVDDTLTVNGTVTLGASGTVTITADPFRPEAGEYTLLHTSGLTLEDGLGGWSVVSELRAPAKVALKRRGDDLVLVVTRPGTSILFR